MAGKKSFEEGKALDQALVAFWHSGYESTSYGDLEAATGLKKSSLYNAFGDKKTLYNKCLERFEETYESAMLDGLDRPNLRMVLSAYFDALLEHFAGSDVPCGSLTTLTPLQSGECEGRSESYAKSQLDVLMSLLSKRFQRAVNESELPSDTDAVALASMFFVLSRGLAVLHHNEQEIAILRKAFAVALEILEHPPRLDGNGSSPILDVTADEMT